MAQFSVFFHPARQNLPSQRRPDNYNNLWARQRRTQLSPAELQG
jgi:hypothetical protein